MFHLTGQAIVGNVNSQGGGAEEKNKEQPHAKQITDAHEQAMPNMDAQGDKVPVTSDEKRCTADRHRVHLKAIRMLLSMVCILVKRWL